ncbi:hypothetical protein J437_LFUL013025 [Ladona fulva]|uniref:Endonuclease/exonuclease/phosphatase domain-containing protein n=1 Tax=Ladona fulva TaxID=123851 RepID=A0A8K0KPH6_LADFU|nr:hypothetical protein J437_LFUL013025 [Ladona fulva]
MEVLKVIPDVDISDLRVHRIGCPQNGRVRPLKVILGSSSIAQAVLQNKKLINIGVKLQADRTLAQRQHFKSLQKELEDRRLAGELDLIIRLATYYQNVHRLRTKLGILGTSTSKFDYDVIVFTETWLHSDIKSSELAFNPITFLGVTVVLKHRKNVVGVDLKAYQVTSVFENIKQVFTVIQGSSAKILIGAVYLPPSSGLQLFEEHAQSVESLLLSENFSDVAVLGDYNIPNNWNTTGDDHTTPQAKALIHAFNFLGLKQ